MESSTIRYASDEDLPVVRALMQREGLRRELDDRLLRQTARDGQLPVLETRDGEVVAAAAFTINNHRGRLLLLVVSPDGGDPHALEHRMVGVVEAICTAYGAPTLEVPPALVA